MCNKSKPFLSVIIPVYNGSHYLRETIESILCQPCKDFELLLINDGSKDNSLDICKFYEGYKVKVFTQANRGVSLTRNEGIARADGQWIIFVDQDDAMRKNFYTEEIKNKLYELGTQQVDLVVPGAWWCDSQLAKGRRRYIEKETKCCGMYYGRNDTLSWNHMFTFNMCIYSRSLFFDKEGAPSPVRFFPLQKDVETTFRHMALYTAQKILFSDEFAFCLRRCNEESVSSTWDWMQVYPVVFDAYLQLIDWHKKNFPSDITAIRGAEKALLRRVCQTICEVKDNNAENLKALKCIVERYVKEGGAMHSLLIFYPKEGHVISQMLNGIRYVQCEQNRTIVKVFTRLCKSAFIKMFHKKNKEVIVRGNLL